MSDDRKSTPSLAEVAQDFHLDPVPEESERPDPRDEEGDSAGARVRRTARLMVNDNLRTNMGGNGSA